MFRIKLKQQKRAMRHKRVRARIKGTSERPRLSVFRSSKHIYAQLVDDEKGRTLAAASDRELKSKVKSRKSKLHLKTQKPNNGQARTRKTAFAYEVGKLIAERALAKNIRKVVFDRGGYKYHGRVKAVAEGAREGGIQF